MQKFDGNYCINRIYTSVYTHMQTCEYTPSTLTIFLNNIYLGKNFSFIHIWLKGTDKKECLKTVSCLWTRECKSRLNKCRNGLKDSGFQALLTVSPVTLKMV